MYFYAKSEGVDNCAEGHWRIKVRPNVNRLGLLASAACSDSALCPCVFREKDIPHPLAICLNLL